MESSTLGRTIGLIHDHESRIDTSTAAAILQCEGVLPFNLKECNPSQFQDHAYSGAAVERRHPWLANWILCPWCADPHRGVDLIDHAIYEHVDDEIEIGEAGEYFDQMENAQPTPPDRLGLAVYFQTPDERTEIMLAARHQGLTTNAYLAAALRMILREDLCVREFALPDPDAT